MLAYDKVKFCFKGHILSVALITFRLDEILSYAKYISLTILQNPYILRSVVFYK